MNPKKILVVEDSELIHKMYDLVLGRYRQSGSVVLHASHGLEAITILSEHPDTDLILLDINMPVMSGLEFLSRVKQHQVFQAIPVIIVSTEGKEEDAIRGLQAGARGYLKKPFREGELRALIEKVLGPRADSGSEAGTP